MTEQTNTTRETKMIAVSDLKVTAVNMRHTGKKPDVSDIIESVRQKGVIQSLLVRPNCDGYEVVAGERRYYAAVEAEVGSVPCVVMKEGDDAEALELSLLENLHRLDPDALTQFETFAKLKDKGRTVEDIAATFGIPVSSVKKRLALANVNPRIRALYRKDQVSDGELQTFTLATPAQQKAWLKLYREKGAYAPRHGQLHHWLFDKGKISVSVALFDPEDAKGGIVEDLFQEDRYFSDGAEFWTLQNEAIAARADAYREKCWDVEIMDVGASFWSYEYAKTAKSKGGGVYIETRRDGSVLFHEGYITEKEAKRKAKQGDTDAGEDQPKAVRGELTNALESYVALYRAAAVRVELAKQPKIALRLMVASVMGGSDVFRVDPDPERPWNEAVAGSYNASPVVSDFEKAVAKARKHLGWADDRSLMTCSWDREEVTAEAFAQLLTLSDKQVMEIAAVVMAEALLHGSGIVEILGSVLEVDMGDHWSPDDTFFDLVRDKEAMRGMVQETAGKAALDGNATATGKVLKGIIRDALNGENGRKKVEGWLPRYFAFPFAAYRTTAGTSLVAATKRVAKHFKAQT